MHAIQDRLTYANVMATIAVFIALGGTSLAAAQLGRDTVGSEQIVNGSIAGADIAVGAVRSSDIRDGTITHKDVRDGTLRGRDVATNTIDSRNLADSGIHADDLDRDSVTGRAILDGSITASDLAAGTIPQLQKPTEDGPADVPSLRTLGTGANQAAAGNDSRLSDARTPKGPAGGSLAGTFPNPTIGAGAIDSTSLFSSSLKDGAASAATLRSLGTGAGQAAAGNDSRLSDARTPTGPAGGDLTGTFPNPTIGTGAIDSTSLFDSSLQDGATGTPTLRSLGTGANQAAAGNDSRLSNARTPTGSAGGDLTGTYPNPTIDADAVDSGKVANGTLRLADYAVTNVDGSFGGGTVPANDCAAATLSIAGIQAGDRVFFLWPNSIPTSIIIPPQVWPGGASITTNVCNMDNAPATIPNPTTLSVIALR